MLRFTFQAPCFYLMSISVCTTREKTCGHAYAAHGFYKTVSVPTSETSGEHQSL